MRARTSTRWLAVSLVLLLAADLAVRSLRDRSFESGATVQGEVRLFADLAADQIEVLELAGPDDQAVRLVRTGSEPWRVASEDAYRAAPEAVQRILDDLCDLRQGQVVTRAVEDPERYGLATPQGIHLLAKARSGDVVADLMIGHCQDRRHTYVQFTGQSEVRKIPGNLRQSLIQTGPGGWRDRTILDEGDAKSIRRIIIASADGRIVFQRRTPEPPAVDTPGWEQLEPHQGTAVTWQLDTMARALTQLKCDRFYSGTQSAAELSLDPPDVVITGERDGQDDVVLHLAAQPIQRRYAVMLPDEATIWLIAAFRGEAFLKDPEDYLQESPREN